jgi:hypothetical protein
LTRRTEFPNFGAGTSMTSEEWWAPIFYKTFLDLDMPKEDVDEVRALADCHSQWPCLFVSVHKFGLSMSREDKLGFRCIECMCTVVRS